jgi:hypothetical protein
VEHELYALALSRIFSGALELRDDRVVELQPLSDV